MDEVFAHPGCAGFQLPSGERDLLEVLGRPDVDPRVVPAEFESGLVIALAVDDVAAAREELAAADVELIGDVVWASEVTGNTLDEGWGWSARRAWRSAGGQLLPGVEVRQPRAVFKHPYSWRVSA